MIDKIRLTIYFLIVPLLISVSLPSMRVLAEESADTEISEQSQEEAEETVQTSEEEKDKEHEEETSQKPKVEGKFQVRQISQTVNYDSQVNPDNETLDIKESKRTISVYAQISDYLDEKKSIRWMFKTYGYSLYEENNNENEDEDLIRIDELFVDWAFGNWFVSVGKRRNTWGTTSAFNPINVVVPPKNPLIPDPQTEGHPIFLINYANDRVSFDLIYTMDYDRDWFGKHYRWGGRFNVLFDDIDIGFYYFDGDPYDKGEVDYILSTEKYSQLAGFSYSSNFTDDATLYVEIASFSQNGRFYYTESGAVESREESVIRAALGSVITLDNDASILLEVYHNGSGYTKEERKNYYAKLTNIRDSLFYTSEQKEGLIALQLFNNQIWAMNQNYLLFTYSKSFWEKYSAGLSIIAAEDSSTISTLSGSYNITDYFMFEASLRGYSGEEDS
ncbi:hypothetical protein KKA14_06915, partial [bacterium]|nr:hypothetical protein [bacterium]